MLGTVLDRREALNITHYELFSLRDADSGSTQPTGTFGLVTDTHVPSPPSPLTATPSKGVERYAPRLAPYWPPGPLPKTASPAADP